MESQKLMSTDEMNKLFPSIADSYDCVSAAAARDIAYEATLLAEIHTILAKRKGA